MAEEVVVFSRRFVISVEGPDADRRFSATIRDRTSGQVLTRTPVRGRSAAEVRDRALEVLHNLVGLERVQEIILEIARALAPGAIVEISEDAQAVYVRLTGPWELAVPFALPRDDLYDPGFDPEDAREKIAAHFTTHLRPGGRAPERPPGR
ncbi:MAG: hypothetical protein QN141_12020 [Armatimonadota bacterium]|nr:hypothetical protein [Armatimonadota bacterium]MDR7494767.1 hypothetical protein [Armatimonadota bacterium]MDR7499592.1 hypothetical protein [Armatimonadota bacterium]MDR7505294.1 hypothetical protein [Armatimonadota bacterium]MDR7547659.1 hypothetical protein [Armatimonadota bacterium]